jgi:hypothetical protein
VVAEVGTKERGAGKPTHWLDKAYAVGELQKHAEEAGRLTYALQYLSLEKKPTFFPGYLREQSCSEARLEKEHKRIEGV